MTAIILGDPIAAELLDQVKGDAQAGLAAQAVERLIDVGRMPPRRLNVFWGRGKEPC